MMALPQRTPNFLQYEGGKKERVAIVRWCPIHDAKPKTPPRTCEASASSMDNWHSSTL